jgi:rhodanese-related sulfurtransferase
MQVQELFERKEAVFVDAREGSVYSAGHIKGAVSLPVGEFESRLKTFRSTAPLDSQLVIYCSGYGCHDSKSLGERLLADGYRRILLYEGGYPEWKAAGLPIEGATP